MISVFRGFAEFVKKHKMTFRNKVYSDGKN